MGDFQSPDLIQERIDYERRSELVQDEQGDFSEAPDKYDNDRTYRDYIEPDEFTEE